MYYDVDCVKLDRKYEKYRAALKKFKVKNSWVNCWKSEMIISSQVILG